MDYVLLIALLLWIRFAVRRSGGRSRERFVGWRFSLRNSCMVGGWWGIYLFDVFLSHPSNILALPTQAHHRALITLCRPMEVFVSLRAVILTSYPRQRCLECNQGRGLLLFLAGEVGDNVGQHTSSQGHQGHGGQGLFHSFDIDNLFGDHNEIDYF